MRFPARRAEGSPPGRRERFARLGVEVLEERCLLAADAAAPPTWWYPQMRMAITLTEPRGNPDVVFLGDSITEYFQDASGAGVWNSQIVPLKADNFGVGGATTQNLLWQIDGGQLQGISPKVVVLMIGVNNLGEGDSPADTASGVAACVNAVEQQLPNAHILLLNILPVGADPSNPIRAAVTQTNALIDQLTQQANITHLDVGGSFLSAGGFVSSAVLGDYLHPTALGYQILSDDIRGTIEQLLSTSPPPAPTPAAAPTPTSSTNLMELGSQVLLLTPAPATSQAGLPAQATPQFPPPQASTVQFASTGPVSPVVLLGTAADAPTDATATEPVDFLFLDHLAADPTSVQAL